MNSDIYCLSPKSNQNIISIHPDDVKYIIPFEISYHIFITSSEFYYNDSLILLNKINIIS